MEIIIKAEPKEVAALVLAVQERQGISTDKLSNSLNLQLQGLHKELGKEAD